MNFLGAPKVKTQAQQQPAYTSIATQTSTQGKPITLGYGRNRIAPNLIWYGDFTSQSIKTSSGAGGGKGAGSTGENSHSVTYIYATSVQFGLCEGPVGDIITTYVEKQVTDGITQWWTGQDSGHVYYNGSYTQDAWPYLVTTHPDQAIPYRGLAHLDSASLRLGTNNNLYQFNFTVDMLFAGSVSGKHDADPSLVIADYLSNDKYGAGFPSARIGDLTTYQNYTLAAGLLLSFFLDSQTAANSTLQDIATATNSEFVWSSGNLTLVPYGDEDLTGNGKTYTAPSAPLYDLTDDDFIFESSNTDPVVCQRKRPSDANNSIKIEYLDASNDYNTAVAEFKDQASIDQYGLRQASTNNTHLFTDATAANLSVQLQGQRQAIRNKYSFTTDMRYVVLDPMDIVTVTDGDLNHQWVRILEMSENDDFSITFLVEEYLAGTGHAPLYSFQTSSGYQVNYNVDPGDANTPVIFEPPVQIATTSGFEVWLAASGGTDWGGCNVYISTDDDNYKYAGQVNGPARQGVLTSNLGSHADPDTSDTLSVNLAESKGELLSGSQDDADQGHTLCYVDGELIAYQTATLTSANHYDLTYLRRGMYGTTIGSHSSGSQFARLDAGIFVYPYDKSQIGQTIYIKLLSFNTYGSNTQALADVSPYTHVISGPPAPANIANFIAVQNGNAVVFTWAQVQPDFSIKGYDIGYAPQGTTDWTQFTMLTEAAKGTEMTNADVPAGSWTFGIRAMNTSDKLSPLITPFDLVVTNNNDTTTVQQQEPDWAGTMSGFIRHWTGVLVPDSTTNADHTSDFTVFDTFVPDPVASAYYITPTYDIGFENSLRIHSAYALTEGPGQTGSPTASVELDAWTSGSDPGTYIPWVVGTIPVRFLNMKITYAPSAGSVAYLSDFTYTVDRSPVIELMDTVVIAPGGTTVTFAQPFHTVPYVLPTAISATPLYATASSITTTDCLVHIWDSTDASVGGTATVKASGF